MSTALAISTAVTAHAAWKRRLALAVETGKDASTPTLVRVDSTCDFGRWLYGADTAIKSAPQYAEVKALHAAFHAAAADVLTLAVAGRKAEATAAMAPGSAYAAASMRLVNALSAWGRVA
jgi:hypothetical protein